MRTLQQAAFIALVLAIAWRTDAVKRVVFARP